jgi:TonB family protein
LNTLLLCLAVFAALAMNAELNVDGELDDSLSGDLTRMRRIIVQTMPPPPPTKVATASEEKPQPIKRPAAEGKPRPPSKPRTDPGGSAQVAARDLVGRIFGGPGAAGVMGPGGLGKDLSGALGAVVAVNGDGNGGWSIRGNGAGGPNAGDPIGIGGIPTSGVAKRSGIGKLCSGPGPCKQDIPPENVTEEPVCSGGGCMDKELIRKVIAGHRDQIRYCYELALQQAPGLAGKVGVRFYVAGNGSVSSADIDQNSTRNDTLSSCLVSRVRTWQFPVGRAAGGYRVTYPFVFRPSGGG